MDAPGSSRLTPEQSLEMLERYGRKYLLVADGVKGMGSNRKQRRAQKKRGAK